MKFSLKKWLPDKKDSKKKLLSAKQDEDTRTPLQKEEDAKRSKRHNYCRTHAFKMQKIDFHGVEYMEMNECSSGWVVQKYIRDPFPLVPDLHDENRDKLLPVTLSDSDMRESDFIDIIVVKEGLCFFEAMKFLARYEVAKPQVEKSLGVMKVEEDLGSNHYLYVGHDEALIFDQQGMPHLTEKGRPLGNGRFSEEELGIAAAVVRREEEKKAAEMAKPYEEEIERKRTEKVQEKMRTKNLQSLLSNMGGTLQEEFLKESTAGKFEFYLKATKLESHLLDIQSAVTAAYNVIGKSGYDNWKGLVRHNRHKGLHDELCAAHRFFDEAAAVFETDKQPDFLKNMTLEFHVVASAILFRLLRNVSHLDAGSEKEEGTEKTSDIRTWFEESFCNVELAMEDMGLSAERIAAIRADVMKRRDFKACRNLLVKFLENIDQNRERLLQAVNYTVEQDEKASTVVSAETLSQAYKENELRP